jgi:hypothetical protein
MNAKNIRAVVLVSVGALALVGLLLWLGAASPVRANPGTRYVAPSPTGSDTANDCTAPISPCATIQHAIDMASDTAHDEIHIAGGTYTSAVGTVAVITKEVTLEGRYGLDFVFDPDSYETVLDAQWGGSVISINNASDVMLHFLTLTHGDGTGNCGSNGCGGGIYVEDTTVHIGHCVITNNVGSESGNGAGGGIYVDNYDTPDRDADIWGSHILSNTANALSSASNSGRGGGIYIRFGTASLRESEILNNVGHKSYVGSGGGICLDTLSSAEVLTNTIRGNKAATSIWASYGGGLLLYYSSAVYVAGNRIEDNLTNPTGGAGYGAGVYVVESDAHLARNTIVSNSIGTSVTPLGSGVYIESNTPVTLSNNLIAHNNDVYGYGSGVYVGRYTSPASQALLVNNTMADNGASGVVAADYAVLTMTNNLIASHTVGLTNTCPASSTITADTNLFWNTSDPITGTNGIQKNPLLTADYHLGSGSPARDTGLNISWLTVDLEGTLRPQGTKYDIGAFEAAVEKVYLPLILKGY